jgi:Holliday junction resolvase RusA-like endonuclease
MAIVSFTIPGRVKGKGRPRARIAEKRDGTQFVHVFTDEQTRGAEALVREIAKAEMGEWPPFEGPMKLTIAIFQQIPVSWSKKEKARAVWITTGFDLDNIVKSIGDALNTIVWRDDKQVAELHVTRRYDDGTGDHVDITIEELEVEVRKETPAALPLFRQTVSA